MVLQLLCDDDLALAILAACCRPEMRALYRVSALWARAVQTVAERDAANIPHLQFLPGHVPAPQTRNRRLIWASHEDMRAKWPCAVDRYGVCWRPTGAAVPCEYTDWLDAMNRVYLLLWLEPHVKFHQLFDQCLVNMGYHGVFGCLHPIVHSRFLDVPQLGWACSAL